MPKRGGRGGKSSAPLQSEEDSHIVFADAKSAKKKDKQKEQTLKDGVNGAQDGAGSKEQKPDTRTPIGGASWTGKLPVNLLSEHCQKQRWAKPEYAMSRNADGFSSMVILKSTNPKTQEITTLPPFKLPPQMKYLANQPTAVEARHFAVTYALFRISSMKNVHMMLPLSYRDLWKNEFQELKTADVKEGKAWMYKADPFMAKAERDQAQALAAKKREEREKQKAKEAENPTVSLGSGIAGSSRGGLSKAWAAAPKVEMGKYVRTDVEKLIRQHTIWNADGVSLTASNRTTVVEELVALGFRKSHAEEAAHECSNREEALEWLLIHVPEDDLPKWAFPEGYTAGVSLASGDIKKQSILLRLAQGGYSAELCAVMLDTCQDDESFAAETLQEALVGQYDGKTRISAHFSQPSPPSDP